MRKVKKKRRNRMQAWIVDREQSRQGGWSYNASMADNPLCSFVVVTVAGENSILQRTKTTDGKNDLFMLAPHDLRGALHVVGKIQYTGDWRGVA